MKLQKLAPKQIVELMNNVEKNTEYQWVIPPRKQAPPFSKELPKGEGFSPFKVLALDLTAIVTALGILIAELLHFISFTMKKIISGKFKLQGIADLGILDIYKDLNQWQNFDEFGDFFKPWTFVKKPEVSKNSHEDAEFGHQRLVGINPAFIKKCLPEYLAVNSQFPVTENLIKTVLGENFELTKAFEENRLFILDYGVLQELTVPELQDQLGRYPHAPFCLFYLNETGDLLPIAIQIDRQPHPEKNPIYTPASSEKSWLMAKMVVASADAAYQGIVSHLLFTHLVMEVMIVATNRTLSQQHILWQLLSPHYFNTLAINTMARTAFLGRGAFFDTTGALGYTGSNELISRSYSGQGQYIEYQGDALEFYQLSLPYSIKLRGVENIPNYHYKDDAQLIWDAIFKYVQNVLTNHYPDAEALAADQELQAWKEELISPNLGGIVGLLPPEMSDQLTGKLTSLDALIFIATNIIFTGTAQHSAVNFGQYDYAAWVPNMAFAMYQKIDDLRQESGGNIDELVKSLPNRLQSLKQIVLVKTLVIPPPITSHSLKTFPCPFVTEKARDAFSTFKKDLDQIETKIKSRNALLKKAGKRPYVYLLPSRIGQSVAI